MLEEPRAPRGTVPERGSRTPYQGGRAASLQHALLSHRVVLVQPRPLPHAANSKQALPINASEAGGKLISQSSKPHSFSPQTPRSGAVAFSQPQLKACLVGGSRGTRFRCSAPSYRGLALGHCSRTLLPGHWAFSSGQDSTRGHRVTLLKLNSVFRLKTTPSTFIEGGKFPRPWCISG